MSNKITRIAAITAIAGVAVFGLSACATSDEASEGSSTVVVEPTTEPSVIGGDVLAPVTEAVADLATKGTVDVPVGAVLNINVPDADTSVWSATSSDPAVATFTAGVAGTNGSATTNPGFTAAKVGTTKVTLTNSATGEVVNFTINVVAK